MNLSGWCDGTGAAVQSSPDTIARNRQRRPARPGQRRRTSEKGNPVQHDACDRPAAPQGERPAEPDGATRETDERFMFLALEQADLAAQAGEVPIGAVVVCDGEVVAAAHNRRETDADPSAHAEFSALVAASRRLGRWRLTGCTVYVTLEPCLMCAGLMVNARIDRCVYGAPDPKGGALGTLYDVSCDPRLNHAFEVVGGVLQDECADLLRSFFRRRRAEARAAKAQRALGETGAREPSATGLPAPDGPHASVGASS